MYLKKIGIINYKSCQKILIDLAKDSPNTFIGINDSGKTGILKAIGLLLDEKPQFNFANESKETGDISNTCLAKDDFEEFFSDIGLPIFEYQAASTLILAEFVVETEELNGEFDEGATNQLKWAIESKRGDSFFVLRKFDTGNPSGKYYICLGESAPARNLWTKKVTELRTIREDVGLTDEDVRNLNNKGPFSNFELIRAIYGKVGHVPTWVEAPDFHNNADLLPEYLYIDWNTSFNEINKLANSALKAVIGTSKIALIKQANAFSQEATDLVNVKFEEVTRELTQDVKGVTGIKAQVTFAVSDAITNISINKKHSDGFVGLDSQGEGIKRQIYFAILKWVNKEKQLAKHKNTIWCFDEPESHLYPTAQRELYKIIAGLSEKNFQILLGTHSTIFVDRTKLNEINKVVLEDKYSEIVRCAGIEDVHEALGVRNSDILFFDKFVVVEGDSEEILMPHFYKLCTGRTLEEDSLKLIPLGGSGEYKRNKLMFEKILKDYKKIESVSHYIFDNDTGETASNMSLIGTCDLEDVLSNDLWLRLLKEECGLNWTETQLNTLRSKLNPTTAATKMYRLISEDVRQGTAKLNILPSKKRCAEIFKTYIVQKTEVPEVIQTIIETKIVTL